MLKKSLLLSFIIIFLDQLIKILIDNFLHADIIVIKDFLNIIKVYNTGAAFSIFTDQRIFLIVISLIMLFIIIKFIKDYKENFRNVLAFSLVIGGLVGNLIDRIIYGHVIDYIAFSFGNYNFPVFNLADIAIVVGVGLLFIATLKKEDNNGDNSTRK